MLSTVVVAIFVPWTALAFAWVALVIWVCWRLRSRHAAVYESIGSFDLFWNNSAHSGWLFLRFLLGSEWHGLDDPQLRMALRLMQALLVAFPIGLIAIVVLAITAGIR